MTLKTKVKKKIPIETPIHRLADMLQHKRPANTVDVDWFIERYIEPVCNKLGGFYDDAGNYIVRIGEDSRVLFSSHTDTVHSTGGKQRVVVSGDFFKVSSTEQSNCLGADDTTGVWLMLEILRQPNPIKGLYIFHASEEIGGIGSSYIAKNYYNLLHGIDYAIAFDRKGTTSIVTHQAGGRCCSEDFSDSLAKLLPAGYVSDAGGTFTDTANYTDIIPECTNISVGYFSQHTSSETQSISHAMLLRDAMLKFDESKLVCKRVAGEIDYNDELYYYNSFNRYSYGYGNKHNTKKKYKFDTHSYYDLYDYVRQNPDKITDFLNDLGYDAEYFYSYHNY